MSGQKYLAIGLVVAVGVFNGYYTFNQAFVDEKQKRDGTYMSSTLQPGTTKTEPQPQPADRSKPEGDNGAPRK
ncbi:hypothetical protein B0T16DRAFT_403783 [Cercophora newfieldiana]|uniref:Uncharacterized protein n=1 Tax=Cercophora newfieldiana TaxID=92897 RepID=A0AA40CW51_9PEZI|nr:hypothetical protein B0T16DRAFT_403783 [Cercophora newfieldiana]